MNPFELQQNKKRRRTIVGEKVSKLSDNRNRKKIAVEHVKRNLVLLSEIRKEGHRGRFLDNRLGENIIGLTDDQKAAKRMQKLCMRRAAHAMKRSFALADIDQGMEDHSRDSVDNLVMTHGGKPIMEIPDEFLTNGALGNDDLIGISDSEEVIPANAHFGGGGEELRRKSRKDVYDEIIAKSKAAKAQRAAEKDEQENKLEELDAAFGHLQEALKFRPFKRAPEETKQAFGKDQVDTNEDDGGYDRLAKSLIFDSRTQPTNRLKTAAELAADRVAKLEAMEKTRQQLELEASAQTSESEVEGPHDPDEDEDQSTSDSESEKEGSCEEESEDEDILEARELMDEVSEHDDSEKEEHDLPKLNDQHGECEELDAVNGGTEDLEEDQISWKLKDTEEDKGFCGILSSSEKNSGRADNNDILKSEFTPAWAVNDPNELHLPFKVQIPSSREELENILKKENPRSQWKLLHRLRVAMDPSINANYHLERKQLLKYLLEYLEHMLSEQFRRSVSTDTHIASKFDAFILVEAVEEHLLDLGRENITIIRDFIVPRLLNTCLRAFPNMLEELQTLQTFISWESQIAFETDVMEHPEQHLPCSSELALVYLICVLCPQGITGRMIMTPIRLLLDTWASEICQLRNVDFNPIQRSALFSSTVTSLSRNKLPDVEQHQINLGFTVLALQLVLLENTHFYSSTILPLACGLLTATVRRLGLHPDTQNEIDKIREILACIQSVVSIIQSYLSVPDILILNIILPTTTSILSSEVPFAVQTIIETFDRDMRKRVNQPLLPLHLAPTKPQGIRMLTPRYVDPRQQSGARYLRLRGATEEQVAAKKLRKETRDARRGAARQLRHDAKFLGALQAQSKRKHDKKLEEGYKRFVKVLNQDREEIHKLKTSGGGMDTSLKAYAARKKLKQQRKRPAGNKTTHR